MKSWGQTLGDYGCKLQVERLRLQSGHWELSIGNKFRFTLLVFLGLNSMLIVGNSAWHYAAGLGALRPKGAATNELTVSQAQVFPLCPEIAKVTRARRLQSRSPSLCLRKCRASGGNGSGHGVMAFRVLGIRVLSFRGSRR